MIVLLFKKRCVSKNPNIVYFQGFDPSEANDADSEDSDDEGMF